MSLNGHYVLSGSSDKTIKIWKLQGKQCIATLEGHQDTVNSVALSFDGLTAISGGADGLVKVWALDWELGNAPCSSSDRRLDLYLEEFVRGEGRFKRLESTKSTKKSLSNVKELLYVLSCAGFGALEPEELKQRIRKKQRAWIPFIKSEDSGNLRDTGIPDWLPEV